MSLFEYNVFRKGEELTPPELRSNTITAWLRAILRPIHYLKELFIDEYSNGFNGAAYDNGTTYIKYDRVKFTNQGVYELRVTSSVGVPPEANALSQTNWIKILDNFIGANERVHYNCQMIVWEYALNRWFSIDAAPYAYIQNVGAGMGTNFTNLYFPVAVYTALGATNAERFDNVKQFFDKYAPAGQTLLSVFTY